jgi:hypothetical protein
VDETLDPAPLPDAVAALALRKARAVAVRRRSGLVLGADTIVVVDGDALGRFRPIHPIVIFFLQGREVFFKYRITFDLCQEVYHQ